MYSLKNKICTKGEIKRPTVRLNKSNILIFEMNTFWYPKQFLLALALTPQQYCNILSTCL